MATPLDQPHSDEELYLGIGDELDEFRPVFQGDVFRDISIAGYPPADHSHVAVLQHPCSMRRGPMLRERVAVVPIRPHRYVARERWATGYTRVVPYPGLAIDDVGHTAAHLDEPGTVLAGELRPERRIAQLSVRGVLLFQQRVIYCSSHAVVGLDTLEEFSAPALAEAELLADWCLALAEQHMDVGTHEALRIETAAFERYIRLETDIQTRLDEVDTRADARRAVRAEIDRRLDAISSIDDAAEPQHVDEA